MIKFENINYLFLLLVLIPVLIFSTINLIKFKKAYLDFPNAKKIIRKIRLRILSFSLAWIFLVLALVCPLWGEKPVSVRQRGVSVIFVCDVSKSMTAEDILPNRLSVEKYFLKILTQKLEKALCALVITKGDGVLTVPLSFEKNAINSTIDLLSPNLHSSGGTNLEAGINTALNAFATNRSNSKVIVLCTDGGQTKGNLENIAKKLSATNTKLIIVGFGTKEGGDIMITNKNNKKVLKKVKLEEDFLKEVIKNCGQDSVYINASSYASIESVLENIDSKNQGIEKMIYIQRPVKRNFEMLIICFIFICLGGLLSYEKNK